MNSICPEWLGSQGAGRPLTHYEVLGVSPGEQSAEALERAAQRRIAQARRYQLTHPEESSRRQNAIALALDTLCDASKRRTYDAALASARGRTTLPNARAAQRLPGAAAGQAEEKAARDHRTALPRGAASPEAPKGAEQPVQVEAVFRIGLVSARVLRLAVTSKVVRVVRLRRYFSHGGRWWASHSFGLADLETVLRVAEMARRYVAEQEGNR